MEQGLAASAEGSFSMSAWLTSTSPNVDGGRGRSRLAGGERAGRAKALRTGLPIHALAIETGRQLWAVVNERDEWHESSPDYYVGARGRFYGGLTVRGPELDARVDAGPEKVARHSRRLCTRFQRRGARSSF